jgi:hypothetical protein
LVATLTRWSFRQQCCRNNGFRRSSIHSIYPVRQGKEWFTPPLVIWFIPLILKNVFNYEENDIFGVRLILVGLQVILIFCMALIERRATTVILRGYLRILILVVFGNYRKHKVTQFYTAPTAIRSFKRKCEYVQNTI